MATRTFPISVFCQQPGCGKMATHVVMSVRVRHSYAQPTSMGAPLSAGMPSDRSGACVAELKFVCYEHSVVSAPGG